MKFTKHAPRTAAAARYATALSVCLGLGLAAPSAVANVFASNLRLNNSNTNVVTTPGDSVTINYLLNQHADAGVTVAVVFGTNTLWSTNLTTSGTNRGVNSVVWNGRDANGSIASNGQWTVKVTAASAGNTNWSRVPMTQNPNTANAYNGDGYVWSPQGIAVNNNTNSPYFGRVFVGNAEASGSGSEPGDLTGIGKYNADGSYAGEGAYSTGGWAWDGNDQSPWKIEVGEDDRIYVVDRAYPCKVLGFDQLISTNAPTVQALNMSNWSSPASYAGLSVTGTGANRKFYLSDTTSGAAGGHGVRRWNAVSSGAAATNDVGTTAVSAGPTLDLDLFPQDVAVDSSNRIFVVQYFLGANSSPQVLGFPAFQGTNLTNANWTLSDPRLLRAHGVAAALHTNFLAVVLHNIGFGDYNGTSIAVFNRDDGSPVDWSGLEDFSDTHDYTDAAWDRAGNLYVTDWGDARWRVFSPPGAKEFTTTALQLLKVGPYIQPALLAPQWKTNQCQFQLHGEIGVNYAIETSTNLVGWSGVVTNVAPAAVSLWTVPSPVSKAFFRARVVP